MKLKTINIRDFQRNMKTITDQVVNDGQSFEVYRNAQLVFSINPPVKKVVKTRKKHTQEEYLAALKAMQFRSGEKNLSQRIDEIVYK